MTAIEVLRTLHEIERNGTNLRDVAMLALDKRLTRIEATVAATILEMDKPRRLAKLAALATAIKAATEPPR
jgi:hypothetical protein